jgi:LacI family transcriptional regulator
LNSAASSLKRRTVRLASLINEGTGEDRYFYPKLWEGVLKAEEAFRDFNVRITKFRFSGDYRNQIEVLTKMLHDHHTDLDGLLTVAWHATELNPIIEKFGEKGIPVVTFNADIEDGRRVGYVGAPARRIGQLAAELMSNFVGMSGRIVVLGGSLMLQNHRDTTFGFYSEIKERKADLEMFELYDFYEKEKLIDNLTEILTKFSDVRGLYCTNARNTLTMCEIVSRLGLSGKLKVIGSDVFQELGPYFADNTLQAVIWQNPEQQAYKAVELLYKYATKQAFLEKEYVGIGIVMRNNFDFYL